MSKALALSLLFALSGCKGTHVYLEQYASVGPKDNEYQGDGYPTVISVEREFNDRFTGRCFHLSHIGVGYPWDFGRETEINACGVKVKLK